MVTWTPSERRSSTAVRELLANPVIEDFAVTMAEAQ
jgi:phosphoribosylformylglycinamidine (FGAM) synthase PurS component